MQPIGKLNANRRLWSAGAAALASSSSTAGRPLDVSLQQHQLMPAVTSTSAFSAPASVQHPGQHPVAQLRMLLLLEASFVLLVDDADADADDSSVRLLPDEGDPATLLPLCLRWSFPFVPSGAEETTLIRVFKQSFLLAVTAATFVSSSEEGGFGRMIRIRSLALIDISNVLMLLQYCCFCCHRLLVIQCPRLYPWRKESVRCRCRHRYCRCRRYRYRRLHRLPAA